MPRETMTNLRRQIDTLKPFEEYFYAKGNPARWGALTLRRDGCKLEIVGYRRASGGVAIYSEPESPGYPRWLSSYRAELEANLGRLHPHEIHFLDEIRRLNTNA